MMDFIVKEIEALETSLSEGMLSDRHRLTPRLAWWRRKATAGRRDEDLRQGLLRLRRRIESSVQRRESRLARRPLLSYPEHLPIYAARQEIVRAIRDHRVIIVTGDTGSGKSTQIPKMCLDAGRGISGMIGCTQPRRIAATSVARRIAEELGEGIGRSVGYKIRFSDRTDPGTYIKIMTDGMLLAETQQDPGLHAYDTLIVDEAHERNLNIDFLLGLLRRLIRKREELKVIITSATLETAKFSEAFDSAPVISVEGRLYPVEVRYVPAGPEMEGANDITYVEAAVRAVDRLAREGPTGDMLIFMPTEQDIRETCELLEGRRLPKTTVLPLYARLTAPDQDRVFASLPGRKIVVATNVAETSLTIPGIRYVIDTGVARIPRYVPRLRTTSLPISPISRGSADQRKGRCGRVRQGVCIRLYSEEDYLSRPEFTPPEIQRANLAEVILRMLSLKLGDVGSFPFIDPPNPKSVRDGFELLEELGAITPAPGGPVLTDRGRIMARMPLDPRISRMLLQALDEGCVEEVAVLASALSLQDPRERPIEKAKEADEAHRAFRDAHSDFAGLLNIRNAYERSRRTLKSQSRLRSWCRENFLSFSRMREWCDIHRQILAILEEHGLKARSVQTEGPAETRYAPIHRAVLAGYLANIATKKDKNLYTAARGREVMVFPGSGLFNRGHDWIVAAEMVKTTRLFARTLARIDPAWLEPLGGHLCKSTVSGPYWSRERGEVLASQRISLYGLVIVESRPVPYARIHPEEAHAIFIRSALVEGNVRERFPFLVHNQALAEKIQGLEDKLRRRDLLVSEEAIHDFYAKRLPGISDTRTLKRRIREMGGDAFLRMDETDLVAQTPDTGRLEEYPDKLVTGGISFPLSYRFAPGKEEDGVTVSIPSGLVSAFPPERLDWVIPGLFEEKIMALIKGLPKTYRKRLVPASETAKVIAREMERSDEPLASALSRFLYRRFGVGVPAALWEEVRIPDHLRMRVALKEPDGKEVGAGRDPGILKGPAGTKVAGAMASKALGEARRTWERSGITSWEFGDLPDRVNVEESLTVYPCLEPAEDGVNLRLYTDRKAATATHRRGVERLFVQCLGGELKFLKKALRWPETANEAARLLGGARTLENALLEAAVRRLFSVDIRTAEAFRAHAEAVKPNLIPEGSALMGHALKVAQAYSQARSVVEGIEKANRTHRAVLDVCAEMRAELDRLVPRHFLEIYDNDRLAHLPRYLKAIEIRATRGAHAVERDRAKAKEAARFLEAYERIRSALSPLATEEKRKAIEDYRWMVEEFKVSLFAQELKTPFPVSAKRLEQRLAEIERMV